MKLTQLQEAKYDHGSKTLDRILRHFDKGDPIYGPTGTPLDTYKPKKGIMTRVPINNNDWITDLAIDREAVAYDEDEEPTRTVWIDFNTEDSQNYRIEMFVEAIEIYEARRVL